MKTLRGKTKKIRHIIAWAGSLSALPIAIIGACTGASPMQIVLWLMVVVTLQLIRLLPEAFELKEVYNDVE